MKFQSDLDAGLHAQDVPEDDEDGKLNAACHYLRIT
jgi:hypothetical protein